MKVAYLVLFLFFFVELAQAQYSGGSGSGGSGSGGSGVGWFGGWPTGLPKPPDIPPYQLIPGSTLTLSGSLTNELTGFTAEYIVPETARLVYIFHDSSKTTTVGVIAETISARRYLRESSVWDTVEQDFVPQNYRGFNCGRRSKNPTWYQAGAVHTIEDEVKEENISYTTSVVSGQTVASEQPTTSRAAGIVTVSGPGMKSKRIVSKATYKPDATTPTTPNASCDFSVDLMANFSIDWKLVRDMSSRTGNATNGNTVTELGTYPISSPSNTGTLAIANFSVVGPYDNHIITTVVLNPNPQSINFYVDFSDTVAWTLIPFPQQ